MADKKPTLIRGRRHAGDWQPAFLAMLRNSANIRLSCDAAGINRTIAYDAREADAEFRKRWDDALEDACDYLEAVARMRAIMGDSDLLKWILSAHRRDVYGQQARVDINVTIRKEAERVAKELGLDAEDLIREAERIVGKVRF